MKMLIASHNKHKVKELHHLLKSSGITCVGLDTFNDHEEVEETGQTFEANAILKATHFAHKYQIPSLADDSGIEVEALHGEPGIYSKRYSGQGDEQNNIKLLLAMEHEQHRHARFVAAIAVVFPDGKTFTFEGEVRGSIGYEIKGQKGFGYDPLFIPQGFDKTMAELGPTIKHQISHRAQAIKALEEKIDEIAHYK